MAALGMVVAVVMDPLRERGGARVCYAAPCSGSVVLCPHGKTGSGRKTRVTEPTLSVDRLTPAIGAVIAGVDVSRECSATLLDRLYVLLLEHLVLFFPDQTLTPATLLAFAQTFGELDTPHHVYPHVPGYERVVLLENDGARPPNTDVWHTDLTFKPNPPFASMLYAQPIPASGGTRSGAVCMPPMTPCRMA